MSPIELQKAILVVGTPVAHPIFNLFGPNDAPFHWCTLRKSSKNRRIDR